MVRIKQRYILCEVLYPDGRETEVSKKNLLDLIKRKIEELYGEYGVIITMRSMSPMSVTYIDNDFDIFLIRSKRYTAKMVQSALSMMSKVRNTPFIIKTLHLAGTIRSSKKFLIEYHKNKLTEMLGKCTTEEEKKSVKAAIIKSCQKCKRNIDLLDRNVRLRAEAKQNDD